MMPTSHRRRQLRRIAQQNRRRSMSAEARESFLQQRRQRRKPENSVQRERRRERYLQRQKMKTLEVGSSSNVDITEINLNVPPIEADTIRQRLTEVRRTAQTFTTLPTETNDIILSTTRRLTEVRRLARTIPTLQTETSDAIPPTTKRLTEVRRLARTMSILPTSVNDTILTNNRRRPFKCGRNFVLDQSSQKLKLLEPDICLHCGTKLFKHGTKEVCCHHGEQGLMYFKDIVSYNRHEAQ